jgi:hypothetical protein
MVSQRPRPNLNLVSLCWCQCLSCHAPASVKKHAWITCHRAGLFASSVFSVALSWGGKEGGLPPLWKGGAPPGLVLTLGFPCQAVPTQPDFPFGPLFSAFHLLSPALGSPTETGDMEGAFLCSTHGSLPSCPFCPLPHAFPPCALCFLLSPCPYQVTPAISVGTSWRKAGHTPVFRGKGREGEERVQDSVRKPLGEGCTDRPPPRATAHWQR